MNMNKLLGMRALQVCNCPEYSVAHLEIWKPAVIIFDLGGSACRWHLDHLSFELSNGIHDFLKLPRDYLGRSPP
jgi:hypothetical protein